MVKGRIRSLLFGVGRATDEKQNKVSKMKILTSLFFVYYYQCVIQHMRVKLIPWCLSSFVCLIRFESLYMYNVVSSSALIHYMNHST